MFSPHFVHNQVRLEPETDYKYSRIGTGNLLKLGSLFNASGRTLLVYFKNLECSFRTRFQKIYLKQNHALRSVWQLKKYAFIGDERPSVVFLFVVNKILPVDNDYQLAGAQNMMAAYTGFQSA